MILHRIYFIKKNRINSFHFVEGFAVPHSIFHKPILTIAQPQQLAAAKQKEDFVFPDKFPKDAAHPHLILGGKLLTNDGGVFVGLFHPMLLEGQLHELIAQVDKSNARFVVATGHHQVDSFFEFLVVEKKLYRI